MGIKPYDPGMPCLLCQWTDFVAFVDQMVPACDALFH